MGLISSVKDAFTGSGAARAARRGARAIRRANESNIKDFNQSFLGSRNQLRDFANFEKGNINRLIRIMQGEESIRDVPGFSSALDDAVRQVNTSFAPTGKSLSGQRLLALRDADLGVNNLFFNRLLGLSQPQSTNNIVNLRNLRDSNVANARVGGANAFAAGEIGAANARLAGFNNLLNLGQTALTAQNIGGFGIKGGTKLIGS